MPSSIFKKSVTNFYLLIFLISLSILSIIIDLKHTSTNYLRTAVNDFILSPIQYIVKTPSDFFYSILEETETIAQLELKIDRLCLLYTSPSPRDATLSRMPSSA